MKPSGTPHPASEQGEVLSQRLTCTSESGHDGSVLYNRRLRCSGTQRLPWSHSQDSNVGLCGCHVLLLLRPKGSPYLILSNPGPLHPRTQPRERTPACLAAGSKQANEIGW